MANAPFTRDEVILALDVLYFSGEKHLNAESSANKQLCDLLQKLPIYRIESRNEIFRNESGVSKQLTGFLHSCETGTKNPNIGKIFFTVAFEFENSKDELHRIAESIRKNISFFQSSFGSIVEDEGFPEGVLLGHLHRNIEKRDGAKVEKAQRCAICQLDPNMIYPACGDLLQQHLTVNPVELDGNVKYGTNDFITVCPNCHAALHQRRPWLNKKNCEELLH